MSYVMFIDDLRFPTDVCQNVMHLRKMVICRDSSYAIECINRKGVPEFIYFDHDLGGDDTSMNFVNWLIEHDILNNIIKKPIDFVVHSANPVGAENIKSKMDNYFHWKFVEGI